MSVRAPSLGHTGPAKGSRSGEGFRPDIQGLRGVAVLVVALAHAAVPGLAGGYVGVDVFFVISGFLITRWLLERALDSAQVPFAEFYAARARRILPAAALTLVATCAASVAYLNPVRALSALHDSLWAAAFVANVHFARVGADYFARDDPPSPVQHFWTLAVEEQFYLGLPLLLATALVALRLLRHGRVSRLGLAGVVAAGVAASLIWSIHQTAADPTAAYFSTFARAWELGAGALIAVGLPWLAKVPEWLRSPLTWVGLAGILVAAAAFGPGTPFPGWAALLPVGGAALVVAGGVGSCRTGVAFVLGRRPLRLVGDVSYAFYLWHWPVLVIATQYAGHALSVGQNLVLLGLAFGLSYVTYRAYENPLRHAHPLRRSRRALGLWPVTVSAVVVAAVTGMSLVTTPGAAAPTFGTVPATVRSHERRPPVHRETLREALIRSVSPEQLRRPVPRALAPPLGRLLGDVPRMESCMAGPDATSSKLCELGDPTSRRTLIVLGDSHALMWMPAFEEFAARYRWKLVPLIKPGCVPSVLASGSCAGWYAWALGQVRRLHPRAVVLSQAWSGWGPDGTSSVARELGELAALTHRTAVMEDPPSRQWTALDCLLARNATLGSCTFRIPPVETAAYAAVRQAARTEKAGYVPTLQWFCVGSVCPTVVGTVVVYRDSNHVTATYARLLAERLRTELAAALRG